MPCVSAPAQLHRHHIEPVNDPSAFYACVARDVPMAERRSNPKAKAALKLEWDRLRKAGGTGCWDEKRVREYDDVVAEVRAQGRKAHFGTIFELCVEKNYDIPGASKFKGRVVYRGNDVKDEKGNVALFKDMASCPATLEGASICDANAFLPGRSSQQADAEQAY